MMVYSSSLHIAQLCNILLSNCKIAFRWMVVFEGPSATTPLKQKQKSHFCSSIISSELWPTKINHWSQGSEKEWRQLWCPCDRHHWKSDEYTIPSRYIRKKFLPLLYMHMRSVLQAFQNIVKFSKYFQIRLSVWKTKIGGACQMGSWNRL
jgi:hypothetical protein